jgi:hypothetical protein
MLEHDRRIAELLDQTVFALDSCEGWLGDEDTERMKSLTRIGYFGDLIRIEAVPTLSSPGKDELKQSAKKEEHTHKVKTNRNDRLSLERVSDGSKVPSEVLTSMKLMNAYPTLQLFAKSGEDEPSLYESSWMDVPMRRYMKS